MTLPSRRVIRQFLTFTGVGAVGTAGHYLTLILLVELLSLDPVVSTTMGFVVGALINYILNYKYTFVSNKSHRETLIKFFIVAIIGAVVNSTIMFIGTKLLIINYLLAQVIATGIVLLQNFVLNKVWTFAEARNPS